MKLREKDDKLSEIRQIDPHSIDRVPSPNEDLNFDFECDKKICNPSKEARGQALGWCIWTNLIFCNLSFDEEFTSYL